MSENEKGTVRMKNEIERKIEVPLIIIEESEDIEKTVTLKKKTRMISPKISKISEKFEKDRKV